MKKLIPFFLFLLILASCAKNAPVSFDYVNLTINDNWGRVYSLQVNKDGNTNASIEDPRASRKDYSFIINEQILDSISNVARRVDISKIDTGYNDSCDVCIGYNIELVKDGQKLNTHVKNISQYPQLANLDELVTLLYNVVRTTDMDPGSLDRKK